jgi:hypothetical protein
VALGQRAQAPRLEVGAQRLARRSAGDDQLAVADGLQRADDVPDALALDQPARVEDPVAPSARLGGTVGPEALQVHPAGDDVDLAALGAEAHQLEGLVGAGGDDPVGVAHDPALDVEALGRARVGVALVAAFDDAERMEGMDYWDI